MTFDRPAGTGVLFAESSKNHEKAPDYKGSLKLDRDYKEGEEVKIAGWHKQSAKGPLVSLKVDNWKPKPRDPSAPKSWPQEAQTSRTASSTFGNTPRRGPANLDDDVPF
jgi:hypothetical protein